MVHWVKDLRLSLSGSDCGYDPFPYLIPGLGTSMWEWGWGHWLKKKGKSSEIDLCLHGYLISDKDIRATQCRKP